MVLRLVARVMGACPCGIPANARLRVAVQGRGGGGGGGGGGTGHWKAGGYGRGAQVRAGEALFALELVSEKTARDEKSSVV